MDRILDQQKTITVEYRIRAVFKQYGKDLDEENLRRLFETKLKNAEIFHLPSGIAEVTQLKKIK